MEETITAQSPLKTALHVIGKFWPSLLLILAVAAYAGWTVFSTPQEDVRSVTIPRNAEIEERFGVRLQVVNLVARGGLVDLRYQVLDEGKAKNFGHYTENSPLIIAEDTGQVIDVTKMGQHNHYVEPGRSYYIVYRNTGDALQPGSEITIQIDDLKIEHIVVR